MSYNSSYAHAIAEQLEAAIEAKAIEVPILPDITSKVLSLTQDSESDSAQLAKIIQSDPTLGGHVIRIANSAAYTPNSNLVSLQQAITRLGMVEISNIAISTSLNSKLFKAPGYETKITDIWHHALVTALWAKEISRQLRANVEAAFLCGLLHSIGKAVILQTIADFRSSSDAMMGEYDLRTLFNRHEAAVCSVVSEAWGLPDIVAEAITYYNDYGNAPTEPKLAATVLFASQIATYMIDSEQLSEDDLRASAALDSINLYPDEVTTLLSKTDTVSAGVAALSL